MLTIERANETNAQFLENFMVICIGDVWMMYGDYGS